MRIEYYDCCDIRYMVLCCVNLIETPSIVTNVTRGYPSHIIRTKDD